MANHCIDLICVSCGRQWCGRGCGDRSGPSAEAVERYMLQQREWCERYGKPFTLGVKTDDKCACGSAEVYID